MPRKLFWRYRANAQQAVREGDLKYLKINENTFLFNVVEDPLERANLKKKRTDDYDRLVRAYAEWQATMLPLDPKAYTYPFTASELADHYNSQPPKEGDDQSRGERVEMIGGTAVPQRYDPLFPGSSHESR